MRFRLLNLEDPQVCMKPDPICTLARKAFSDESKSLSSNANYASIRLDKNQIYIILRGQAMLDRHDDKLLEEFN